jgi:hypothetical protein
MQHPKHQTTAWNIQNAAGDCAAATTATNGTVEMNYIGT